MWLSSISLKAQNNELVERIWNVEIEGNERYEDLIIKRYIANQRPSFWQRIAGSESAGMVIDEFEIRKDAIRIERFYQRRGYPNVEVTYELRDGSSVERKVLAFLVTENEPYIINHVEIGLNTDQANQEYISSSREYSRIIQRLPFRTGRRFQAIEEAEVVGLLDRALNNIGYIYATVSVEVSIDSVLNTVDVFIESTPGPRTRISAFNIEGAETLDDRFIFRETGLEIGELYSEEKLREAQREVFKHHLFRLALISIPDQPQDSTLELDLSVKELPLRSFRIRGGAGDFDRLEGPLAIDNFWKLFRAQSTWIYRNLGGKGTQFSTTLKLSFFETFLSTEFLFPYVFNTKSSFTVNPFIENRIEPAYSITTGGVINSLGYEYNRNLTGTFSYEFALNNEYDIANERNQDITQILPDSVLNYNISSFSFNLYYANGLSRGRRGWIVQPYIEFSGIFGESDFTFQKFAFDVRKFTELSPKLVLATRVQAGSIYFAKQDSLPADIEFYAGGTSSVRAFRRNDLGPKRAFIIESDQPGVPDQVNFVPVGGKALLTFNVELRQRLDQVLKGFGVAAFLDGGQVWSSIRRLDERELQYSTGAGLRYQTPIGPIRVDFGYKLNPTDFDLELLPGINDKAARRWRLHFSIGQAF
jgi:outer membrane protein insertion porin family